MIWVLENTARDSEEGGRGGESYGLLTVKVWKLNFRFSTMCMSVAVVMAVFYNPTVSQDRQALASARLC